MTESDADAATETAAATEFRPFVGRILLIVIHPFKAKTRVRIPLGTPFADKYLAKWPHRIPSPPVLAGPKRNHAPMKNLASFRGVMKTTPALWALLWALITLPFATVHYRPVARSQELHQLTSDEAGTIQSVARHNQRPLSYRTRAKSALEDGRAYPTATTFPSD